MTYEPGTVLSFGKIEDGTYEEATVVTSGWVYLTKLNSMPHREAMVLEDWLILNRHRTLNVVDNVPVKKTYKPRTLIRWFSKAALTTPGKGSRRTAVVLPEGAVLQIKKVDGKNVTQDHTFFSTYDEWAATFPSEGSVYYYER
jgi:hypothetical protein